MIVFIALYIMGIAVAVMIGLTQVSMNLDWEERAFAESRERDRQDLLIGWWVVKFSWAWPLLIVSFVRSLARRARHAEDTQAQGE